MSTPNESIFQSRLQSTRKRRDFNQEELAKKAGLPSTAISHFESGARKPSFDNLHKLAEALNVSIDYLMGRIDDMDGSLIQEAQIFRDYGNLTDDDRALANDFMARLAKRNPNK